MNGSLAALCAYLLLTDLLKFCKAKKKQNMLLLNVVLSVEENNGLKVSIA